MKFALKKEPTKRYIGQSEEGHDLWMLGQIFNYPGLNPIGILETKLDGKTDIVFLELQDDKKSVKEITNKEIIYNLMEVLEMTNMIEHIAKKGWLKRVAKKG